MQTAVSCWFRMRDNFLSPPSALEPHLPWLCTVPVHATRVSLSSHVHQFCSMAKTLLPWCHLLPFLMIFFFSFRHRSLNSEGRELMKLFNLGLSVSLSLTLYALCSYVSLNMFPSIARGIGDGWARYWSVCRVECC